MYICQYIINSFTTSRNYGKVMMHQITVNLYFLQESPHLTTRNVKKTKCKGSNEILVVNESDVKQTKSTSMVVNESDVKQTKTTFNSLGQIQIHQQCTI